MTWCVLNPFSTEHFPYVVDFWNVFMQPRRCALSPGSCVTVVSNWIFSSAVCVFCIGFVIGWVYYFNWCQSLRYRIESFWMLTDFLLENSIHYTHSITHPQWQHIFYVNRQSRWNCGGFYIANEFAIRMVVGRQSFFFPVSFVWR